MTLPKFTLWGLAVMICTGCGSSPVSSDTEDEATTIATSSGSGTTPDELEKKENEKLFTDAGSGATSGSGAAGHDTTQMEKQIFGEAVFE